MSWFVDASVVIAILAREADWQELADRADQEPELLWSPVSLWESIVGFALRQKITIDEAREVVLRFGETNQLAMVEIGTAEADLAVSAGARYGRRSTSAAKLNMGDCFAYACAKANGARLLYKGDDFVHTDLG